MENKNKPHSQKISPLVIAMLLATIIVFLFAFFEPHKTNDEEIAIENIQEKNITTSVEVSNETSQTNGKETTGTEEKSSSAPPLREADNRITKKPFGIFITPGSSPVQPERFRGFHTGTDFEVSFDEVGKEIAVKAICPGEVIEKKSVNGYGGVVIQSCQLEDKPITVLYGHLDLQSATVETGETVEPDQTIALLGADKSAQTDGERKHLHLAIRQGDKIDLRGYVDSEKELEKWLDFESLLAR